MIVSAAVFAFMHQKPVVEVAIAQKIGSDRPALLNASGYVTPRRRATVAAKITGRVTGVFFDEGMHVSARRRARHARRFRRAPRARIPQKPTATPPRPRSPIFRCNSKMRKSNCTAPQQLQKAGVQTQEALDTASTNADSLKAKIELAKGRFAASEARIGEAQQAVDNCMIRAPFDGIIVSKDAQVGEMVSPDFRRRRIHPHRHRHDRGHELQRN